MVAGESSRRRQRKEYGAGMADRHCNDHILRGLDMVTGNEGLPYLGRIQRLTSPTCPSSVQRITVSDTVVENRPEILHANCVQLPYLSQAFTQAREVRKN